ncbi:MAG: tRNA (adenosine(37)-N6)-dimethylallyltransferase MiaA [Patescibacteria group bacterium]|nr:tRNA (adenosine(37)-N6)-dimethylallyltransferase MiaA [Patescibacteria group bacterium]MCL5224289.1 tRNA (adenosine(37)-N6)-dimethylallyltransferase MiaA [Patescibacteria group bacterium]
MKERPRVIVVLGPTASGKSDLAVNIAKKVGSPKWRRELRVKGAEIISADSRQVYRGLDIGSGKITRSQMHGIPHHLLGVASPKRVFTAAQYQRAAQKHIGGVISKGKVPIICGGTGFYIDALIYNLSLPSVPPQNKLRAKLEALGTSELFRKLATVDLRRARNIDRHNRRRLIRSLEIALTTGKPLPVLSRNSEYNVLKVGIKLPPSELRRRINLRLKRRLKTGLIKEVTELHKQELSWKRLDNLGLEYRYISRYLRGLISYDEMRSQLQKEIWQYAKRQMTWFKRDKSIIWIDDPRKAYARLQDFLAPSTRP